MLVAIGLRGVSVITCNRCGKENQDHYKFCLGCGSELAKPVAASAPPSNALSQAQAPQAQAPQAQAPQAQAPQALDSRDPALDRTVLPPAPMGATVAGELRTSSPAVPKARGGIPWGDSPKMPAP
ncbi:MAG TPA: zinc ribbon domain-containing protein, partial [Polyangia bacterium]|nr:zinc ribbon domain-containing protein [Polyangia bacterium]